MNLGNNSAELEPPLPLPYGYEAHVHVRMYATWRHAVSVTQSRNFAHDDEAEVLVRNDPGSESRNERKTYLQKAPKK